MAQLRKVSLLIDLAKVERDHHVLEIGSGWGTLAIQVVMRTGCKYTGITLSVEQLRYAQRKVKEAGLEDGESSIYVRLHTYVTNSSCTIASRTSVCLYEK